MHYLPIKKRDYLKVNRKQFKPQIMSNRPDWEILKKLGSGAFGVVHLAKTNDPSLRSIGGVMAVKSAEFSCCETLKLEAELLEKFRDCPHVIRCYGSRESVDQDDGERMYNLFLEYAPGGDLRDLIKKCSSKTDGTPGGLPEEEVVKHTRSLLLGLRFMHESGYVHCDIKPENILIDGSGNAKIADFGLAKRYDDIVGKSDLMKKPFKPGGGLFVGGTFEFMAPELLSTNVNNPASDIWALGCTVIEMITGKRVLEDFGPSEFVKEIESGCSPVLSKGLSWEAKDFLRRSLAVKLEERWTAEMLLDHPFVEEIVPLTEAEVMMFWKLSAHLSKKSQCEVVNGDFRCCCC